MFDHIDNDGATAYPAEPGKLSDRDPINPNSDRGDQSIADEAIDLREQRLFRSLDVDHNEHVYRSDLERILAQAGLRGNDPRLAESMQALAAIDEAASQRRESEISQEQFCWAVRHNILLIERALQGNLIIPDFVEFCEEIDSLYESTRANRSGQPATYIPQLNFSETDVDQYGVALCTVDGQRHSVGDAGAFFSVQSCSKPISYCLALEEHGQEVVHARVGREPSGHRFNELTLDSQGRPHNPMINAGAIMCCALIKLREKRDQLRRGSRNDVDMRGWTGNRFDYVLGQWQALCGAEKPRFNNAVYLSERQTADRNFALGYFMRENGALPEDVDLHEVLDFYFQCCAIELNAEMMSVVATTLANGGICPITGVRVFKTQTVQNCLSLMSSCGMYDFSGEFAFTVGLPAKSGVSGAILVVVPNVAGFCIWSPRLDPHGNSVRGIDFCTRLVQTFSFHNYENLTGGADKKDPRLSSIWQKATLVNQMIWAASKGDLGAMQDLLCRGGDLNGADYDLRTPLHLAAAEGQTNVVQFFVDQQAARGLDLNPRDRWGGTPLDDAYLHGHSGVIGLLESAGGVCGKSETGEPGEFSGPSSARHFTSGKTDELIWAASLGDLRHVRRLVARGVLLDSADYDLRTPLHLAASEGHLGVVRYLVDQNVEITPRDRWGGTPLADAMRHGHRDVAGLLTENTTDCGESHDQEGAGASQPNVRVLATL